MINLQKKRLGPFSGIVIGALVRQNATLSTLILSNNSLGVAGATAIAEATAANPALQQVDIRNNRFGAEEKAAVRAVAPLQVGGRLLVSTPESDAGGGGGEPKAKGAGGGDPGLKATGAIGSKAKGLVAKAGVGQGAAGAVALKALGKSSKTRRGSNSGLG